MLYEVYKETAVQSLQGASWSWVDYKLNYWKKKKIAISNYNKWKWLSLLSFCTLPSWILWCHWVDLLFQTKEPQLSNNTGNAVTSWNPRWRPTGNLKAKISSVYYYLNVMFPLSSKICNLGIICSNLASTRANSRGSL